MTPSWWSPDRGPMLRWPLVLGAGLAIAVALAALQTFVLRRSEPPRPEVVTDIAAVMRPFDIYETLDVQHETDPYEGWSIRVLTDESEPVRDAVLRLFDGRGYSLVRHDEPTPSGCAPGDRLSVCAEWGVVTDSTISVADHAVVIYWYPGDGPVSVWVPAEKLADDGYPAKR